MAYVIAAYAIAIGAILGYTLRLVRERRRLERELGRGGGPTRQGPTLPP